MKFLHVKDFDELSSVTAKYMAKKLSEKKDLNVCLASGGSPDKAYQMFVEEVKEQGIDASNLIVTKLDEWCGVSRDSELSCEKYIRDRVINPLHIKEENFITFYPDSDTQKEVEKVNKQLKERPIDLCILGFGINGHLGLNEPSEYLHANSHKATLTEETKKHPMLQGNNVEYGMTIGMKDILDSKEVLLLMNGKNKEKLYEEFLSKKVSTTLPASFLWLHDNVTVIVRDDEF